MTVVVPLYNGARYISDTLTSLHLQSLRPHQVIVVDDGSSDDGPSIVREHPVEARLIGQDHLGVAVARNRGLAETGTRWVAFLDQDDLWHPSRLERLMAWIEEHPGERVVSTTELAFAAVEEIEGLTTGDPAVGQWASIVVAEATSYIDLCERAVVTGSETVEHVDHHAMLRGPINVTTSFIATAEVLRLAGGFAPHALAMDDYWLLVNAARLSPIAKVDQPTALYRVHLGATSRTTRLALPFLSSAVALRLGGGLVGQDEALERDLTGPLHAHLFDELLRSPGYESPRLRRAARHLAALVWPGGQRMALGKAQLRLRAPWLVSLLRRRRHEPKTTDHGVAGLGRPAGSGGSEE